MLRSARMVYVRLMLQETLAHDTIDRLGTLGAVQFVDLNGDLTAFKRA
jgi:vacuolar-type H+-ATPase subunit I/STV1